MLKQAVILVGGLGTRLGEMTRLVPTRRTSGLSAPAVSASPPSPLDAMSDVMMIAWCPSEMRRLARL